MSTDRLMLRGFHPTDVDAVHGFASDPQVCALLGREVPTWADTVEFVETAMATAPAESLAICLRGSGEVIGSVTAGHFPDGDIEFGSRELTWVLHPAHWGHGYATESVGTLIEELFIDPNLSRVVAFCHTDNVRAQGVAERVGMTRERQLDAGSLPVAGEVFGTVSLDLREAEPRVATRPTTDVKYALLRPGARRTFQPV